MFVTWAGAKDSSLRAKKKEDKNQELWKNWEFFRIDKNWEGR